ncbi:MAG: hypothetical protein HYZ25_18475 [Chloroflexi bacterium]|nr:hypothetical protein [Chloroflexota bacterium]
MTVAAGVVVDELLWGVQAPAKMIIHIARTKRPFLSNFGCISTPFS